MSKDQLRDPEGLTRVEFDDTTYLIAASSLCVADTDRSGRRQVNDGLVRVRYTPEGDLHAEAMSGFRTWLLAHEPSLAEAGELEPDAGGLITIIRIPRRRGRLRRAAVPKAMVGSHRGKEPPRRGTMKVLEKVISPAISGLRRCA